MRLLVIGASGLLGLHLSLRAADRHTVTGVVHAHPLVGVPFRVVQADLTSEAAVQAVIAQVQPDAIVHTAALPYPERCEENPELSERLNAQLPGWVARWAQADGIRLLHVSTDAVFDGVRGGFSEEDIPNPRNTYARHKLAGERAVLETYPSAVIVRTVFYGWSLNGQRSLAEWFFNNLRSGTPMKGFTDAWFCPLEAGELGELLVAMLECGLSGLYHVVSPEAINKYDFGVAIARRFSLDENLIAPASVENGGLKALRSANLSLRCDKLVRDLGIRPPGQPEELDKWYQQWRDGTAERIRGLCA
ncbi:MAG: SDR family oxidoreductase [Anaerolineaceae bacterium]|nr:SDR family oxidoreductase [Anaerolineaceae bacterium]